MTFGTRMMGGGWRGFSLVAATLALSACATSINDDVSKSRLAQPVADEHGQAITAAGDIAIAGQMVAHSIMDLPEVADATVPPLVQFRGVTSVINGPVNTAPYTGLLRDRLLLITTRKTPFCGTAVASLHGHKSKHKEEGGSIDVDTDADYKSLAELRGEYGSDTYLVQIQFIDVHSNQILFNGLYSISREADDNAPATGARPNRSNRPIRTPNRSMSTLRLHHLNRCRMEIPACNSP